MSSSPEPSEFSRRSVQLEYPGNGASSPRERGRAGLLTVAEWLAIPAHQTSEPPYGDAFGDPRIEARDSLLTARAQRAFAMLGVTTPR